MTTYFILTLMAIAIAVIVLFPLSKRRADNLSGAGQKTDGDSDAWEDQKTQITSQLAELESSLAGKKISQKSYKVKKANLLAEGEIVLQALQNSRTPGKKETPAYPSIGVVLGVGLIVATTGLSIYLSNQFATPDTEAMSMPMPAPAVKPAQVSLFPDANVQQNSSVPVMPSNSTLVDADGEPDISAMVAQLEARIEEADAPLNDIMMLAQSYGVLGKDDEAIALYDRAMKLAPENFSVLMTSSEFMSRSEDEKIRLKAESLADKVLAKNPEFPEAMWIKSLSLLKRHEVDEATLILHQLRPLVLNNPAATNAVNSLLDRLAKLPPSSG